MSLETSPDARMHPTVGRLPQPASARMPSAEGKSRPSSSDAKTGQRAEFGTETAEIRGRNGAAAHEAPLDFADLIDTINPLHHIPVISTLYREASDDQISATARTLGGFLYGGPLGFVNGLANAVAEDASGQDLGETLLAVFEIDDAPPSAGTSAPAAPVHPQLSENPAVKQSKEKSANFTIPLRSRSEIESGTATLTGPAALRAFVSDLQGPGTSAPIRDVGQQDVGVRPRSFGTPLRPAGWPLPDVSGQESYPLPRRAPLAPVAMPGTRPPRPADDGAVAARVSPTAAVGSDVGEAEGPAIGIDGDRDFEAAIADQMLLALEKYQAMSRRRAEERARDGG